MQAEELLKQGKLDEALASLQESIRKNAADPKLRVFLFQLLCVMGNWERALTQLQLAAQMDQANQLMARVCQSLIQCELLRADVFAGTRTPVIFGEPEAWMGWMVQAVALSAQGKHDAAAELRTKALEEAAAVGGTVDGQRFEWIMDADPRLGPMLEVMFGGNYYWIPFSRIRQLLVEPPSDLRDVVWSPAKFVWSTGAMADGFIPSRYVGTEKSADGHARLGRKTDWVDVTPGTSFGVGQRVLATDSQDYDLLSVRSIVFDVEVPVDAGAGQAAEHG